MPCPCCWKRVNLSITPRYGTWPSPKRPKPRVLVLSGQPDLKIYDSLLTGDLAGVGGVRMTFTGTNTAVDTDTTLMQERIARVPGRPDQQRFPKYDSVIDLAAGSCTFPAGLRTDAAGRVHRLRAFQFDGSQCMTCALRSQCISPKGRKGRWVMIHPQEALLQQDRALQQSAGYDEYRVRRVVVEHRLARLVHLGIRQSRYFGRAKTKCQRPRCPT